MEGGSARLANGGGVLERACADAVVAAEREHELALARVLVHQL